jgi:hypothetical protein
MDPWYDLHSWSKRYREEALQKAQRRYFVEQAKSNYSLRAKRGRTNLSWRNLVSLLRGVGLSR